MKNLLFTLLFIAVFFPIKAQEWFSDEYKIWYKTSTGFKESTWEPMYPIIIVKKENYIKVGSKVYDIHYVTRSATAKYYATKNDIVVFMFSEADSVKSLLIDKKGLKFVVEFKMLKP